MYAKDMSYETCGPLESRVFRDKKDAKRHAKEMSKSPAYDGKYKVKKHWFKGHWHIRMK